jgi:hypothetical protein
MPSLSRAKPQIEFRVDDFYPLWRLRVERYCIAKMPEKILLLNGLEMEESKEISEFAIEESHRQWLSGALLRFGYIYPQIEVVIDGATARLIGPGADDPSVKRELCFCLYRQKIFEQSLPLRRMLIEGVTGLAGRSS